jgi:hypothetical protein
MEDNLLEFIKLNSNDEIIMTEWCIREYYVDVLKSYY